MRLCIPLMLGLSIYPTFGFAYFPEYEHFTEEEMTELNSPRLVGSEYESDRLTYQFLSDWTKSFVANEESFQYTAGSLGPTRFFTQGRMRLRRSINEKIDFQISYAEQGNLRFHRQTFVFEFYFELLSWLQVSLYGEPSTLKKQDDIGVATTLKTSPHSHLRLFYTWVDFSHNKRNENLDRYQTRPDAVGGVWRWTKSESFIQASFRRDQNTQKTFGSGQIYQYGNQTAQWLSRHALRESNLRFLQTEFNYTKNHEADNINTDGGITRWENQTWDGLMQLQNPQSSFHLMGLRVLYSQWESAVGQVIHNDVLPHVWFTPWRWTTSLGQHNFDVGYEMTWHRGRGDQTLRSTLDNNEKLEHRLNGRYRLMGTSHLHCNLLLTFDLDRFGSGETWEGGALQFATQF